MNLTGSIVSVRHLSNDDRQEMYDLMTNYYDNLLRDKFENDLNEKNWITIFRNGNDIVRGFSTIMVIDLNVNDELIKCVFSGDTIIHRDEWGQLLLPLVWGRFVIMTLPDQYPDNKLYWILISKGYKTYRYLPLHFKSFYPRYDKSTPEFEKTIMDSFGKMKFQNRYNPETGVINWNGSADTVKKGVADITEKHLNDPNTEFFIKSNPEYLNGNELVCIAEASFDNLKSDTQRLLKEGI